MAKWKGFLVNLLDWPQSSTLHKMDIFIKFLSYLLISFSQISKYLKVVSLYYKKLKKTSLPEKV